MPCMMSDVSQRSMEEVINRGHQQRSCQGHQYDSVGKVTDRGHCRGYFQRSPVEVRTDPLNRTLVEVTDRGHQMRSLAKVTGKGHR